MSRQLQKPDRVRFKETEDLPLAYAERYGIDGDQVAEFFGEVLRLNRVR